MLDLEILMQSGHRVARFPCSHDLALLTLLRIFATNALQPFLRWTEVKDAISERGEDVGDTGSGLGAAQACLLETA